jgi:hypothetical protein
MDSGMIEKLLDTDVVFDWLPDDVQASIDERDAWLARLPQGDGGLEFLVSDLQRWTLGTVVTVAFLGGSRELHREIADATREITEIANITLDFGANASAGEFRTWSVQDTEYSADIRVSFDRAGNFSLVGTDSISPSAGGPTQDVGGRPHQRSLNLGGFDVRRPPRWQGTTRHEFLHALSFRHSHQNMRGPCEAEFRWEDDEGYQPTKDADGRFVADGSGRRPGVYTYASGFPNFWGRPKVDHNLRTREDPSAVAGPFDLGSVMLYRFDPLFYRSQPSPCAPTGNGVNLSAGDARGLRLLYPAVGADVKAITDRSAALLRTIENEQSGDIGLESGSSAAGYAADAARILRARIAVLTESPSA